MQVGRESYGVLQIAIHDEGEGGDQFVTTNLLDLHGQMLTCKVEITGIHKVWIYEARIMRFHPHAWYTQVVWHCWTCSRCHWYQPST